jgi:SnoaL-like domain
MEQSFTIREHIVEVVNKLFVYTDNRQWERLLDEVFTEAVMFDMSSAGSGDPVTLPAKEICNMWEKGFQGIDAVHHQAGNYLVTINNTEASLYAYAIAIHYKQSATKGKTREFVGSYDLILNLQSRGWRISSFRYNLKYTSGNTDLS